MGQCSVYILVNPSCCRRSITDISNNMERLHDALSGMGNPQYLAGGDAADLGYTDTERGSILKWLVSTDPSPNHNKACELHEAHTGKWFTSSPEYEDWIGGSTR